MFSLLPGAQNNLRWYLDQPAGHQHVALAQDLGVIDATPRLAELLTPSEEASLARTLLREMLEALAVFESAGIVHRDVKPENWLVDARTHSMRLIDLGAACESSGAAATSGGATARAAGSEIFMPPERLVSEEAPHAFDVYSVAIVWLLTLVPALNSRRALLAFRTAVDGEHDHSIGAWLEHQVLSGSEGTGSDGAGGAGGGDGALSTITLDRSFAFFSHGEDGRLAWRILRALMDPDPAQRITAAQALAGPYLGGCGGGAAHRRERALRLDRLRGMGEEECSADFSCALPLPVPEEAEAAGECALAHEEAECYSLHAPARDLGLELRDAPDGVEGAARVVIASVAEGSDAHASGLVHVGDALLAMGPLDVSDRSVSEVEALLSAWREETVQIRLLRGEVVRR